jgi:hypothetical protein
MHNILPRWAAAAMICCTIASGASAAGPLHGKPRSLSDAERAAVQYAAQYLSDGPSLLYAALSADSPLRQLPADEALREIEVRTGYRTGARWELETVVPSLKDRIAAFSVLFPSGADDAVLFEMVLDEGVYRIRSIRTLGEPADGAIKSRDTSAPAPVGTATGPRLLILFAGLAGVSLSIAAAIVRTPVYSRGLLMAAAAVFIGTFIFEANRFRNALKSSAEAANSLTSQADAGILRLGGLLPLRMALTGGGTSPDFARSTGGQTDDAIQVASAWKAQSELQHMRLDAAEESLATLPAASAIPLVELLRGRIALMRSKEVESALAYHRAIELGPGRDGLWSEAHAALELLGYEDRAEALLRRLDVIGSRNSAVYFQLAVKEVRADNLGDFERLAVIAWTMEPVDRRDLVEGLGIWDLLRTPSFAELIKLNSPAEPLILAPDISTRSIELPAGAVPTVCGDTLLVEAGEQSLRVVGGASLAPENAKVETATVWKERAEQRILDRLPQLLSTVRAGGAGAFLQPAQQERLRDTATVLARRNRWRDLCALTEPVQGSEEHIPFSVIGLRGMALKRTGRINEAKEVIVRLARNRALLRRGSVYELIALAEMLASVQLFEPAIRMLDLAAQERELPQIDDRARNFSMRERLAKSYLTSHSQHFEIRYPPDVEGSVAGRLAEILEAERERISKLIPARSAERVIVNVVWWDEFRSTLTLNDHVIGFYDGEITVPVAGAYFIPPVVALLSHELAHAMIAQATADQAPHWFQEGLAQRVEMVPYHRNAFNTYDEGRMFTLALLEPILTRSPDPEMIKQGYILSQTMIRFIEKRYGSGAIEKFLTAFRSGATTEEAIRSVTGLSSAQFDRELRQWGFGPGRNEIFQNPKPLRYDLYADRPERDGRQQQPAVDVGTTGFAKRRF